MFEPAISGSSVPCFKPVRDVFARGFRDGEELGAALSVVVDGQTVLDLWAGYADPGRSRPWHRDTIVNLYSTTKAMTALCAHRLAERGELDLDRPVADYWPEFSAHGKGGIPVRWLLSHRAGLPAVREPLPPEALYDWEAMTAALAAETPWWTPGEAHGYHAVTYGWLVGEVVRRVSGRTPGRLFREEIAGPLAADLAIGLDARDLGRVADMTALQPPSELAEAFAQGGESLLMLAFMNPMGTGDRNDAAYRTAEIPAINGHGNARALARIYAALARGGELEGVRLLGPDAIERLREEQSRGHDRVLGVDTRFGLGFLLPLSSPEARFGPSPCAFGHPGAGGSVGFADPDARLGFGYTPNRMGDTVLLDPRAIALIDAVYACL